MAIKKDFKVPLKNKHATIIATKVRRKSKRGNGSGRGEGRPYRLKMRSYEAVKIRKTEKKQIGTGGKSEQINTTTAAAAATARWI